MERLKGILKSDLGRKALASIALPAASLGFIPAHHAANNEFIQDNFENRISISAVSNLSSNLTIEDKLVFTLISAGTLVLAGGMAHRTMEGASRFDRKIMSLGVTALGAGIIYTDARIWT